MRFLYCENTEGGMDTDFWTLDDVLNWVRQRDARCKRVFKGKEYEEIRLCLIEIRVWAEKAEIGTFCEHTQGVLIRIADTDTGCIK